MPITEAARHHLLTALEDAIGKEAAMTLADHLPPVGWADVATRRDLDHLEERLEHRLAAEIAGVRTEIADLRSEVSREIAGVRSEVSGEITGVHRELARLHEAIAGSQRLLFFAILGAFTANTGIVVAVLQSSGNG